MDVWTADPLPSGALQPLRSEPENLRDQAYNAIRTAIITRAIPPGARVSEARLASTLNVSKTPVREALLRLASVGLVESDGRYGVRVAMPSLESLRAAYELREGLEAQSARLAASSSGGPEALDPPKLAADACLESADKGDNLEFRKRDRSFHFSLVQVSNSRYLEQAIRDTYDLTWSLRLRDAPVEGFAGECARQHLEILDAVAAADPALAESRMRQHILKVRTVVLDSFVAAQAEGSGPAT